MARFRTVDPAMRMSPQLDGLTSFEQLLLVYLISEADDEGRLLGDLRSVERQAFPRALPAGVRRSQITEALEALVTRRLLVRYTVDGQEYLAIPGWHDGDSWQYQNVSRSKGSRLPSPPDGSCRVKERGKGWLPPDRGLSGQGVPPTGNGELTGDVDVDVEATGRGREADADADRSRLESRGSASALASGADASASPRLRGSELLEALFAVHRDGCPTELRGKLDAAIKLGKEREPEFEAVGNRLLADPRLRVAKVIAKIGGAA